jgi:hypothetical protein
MMFWKRQNNERAGKRDEVEQRTGVVQLLCRMLRWWVHVIIV